MTGCLYNCYFIVICTEKVLEEKEKFKPQQPQSDREIGLGFGADNIKSIVRVFPPHTHTLSQVFNTKKGPLKFPHGTGFRFPFPFPFPL